MCVFVLVCAHLWEIKRKYVSFLSLFTYFVVVVAPAAAIAAVLLVICLHWCAKLHTLAFIFVLMFCEDTNLKIHSDLNTVRINC